jgi:hypothetical protein
MPLPPIPPLRAAHETLPLQSASGCWRRDKMDGTLTTVAARQIEFRLSSLPILVGLSLSLQMGWKPNRIQLHPNIADTIDSGCAHNILHGNGHRQASTHTCEQL